MTAGFSWPVSGPDSDLLKGGEHATPAALVILGK
jgi:hypothetical protein